jgi:hypothetical protein
MTKSKTTPKKPARAPKARRGAPSREKAAEPDAVAPEPDPAPTREPGPTPGKAKVTGHVLGLGDDGEADEATVTQTDPMPDSPPPKPLTKGKKLAPGLYWSEQGQINCDQHIPYPGSDTWVFEHWKKIDRGSMAEATEKGTELVCETCKTIAEGENAPATPRKKKGPAPKPKMTALDPDLTLGHLAGLYLDHLQQAGKSLATQFSYSMDLVTAKKALGNDTLIADLTPDRVAEYFESPEVTMRKNGKPKTKVTIDKCRRVLRLALVWAAEMGLIAEAPLPTTGTQKK